MLTGLSTACFYPMETENAFQAIMEQGIQNTEIFFNSPSELDREYLADIKKVMSAYGGRVISVHPYSSNWESMLFFSRYDRRLRDGIRLYDDFFDAARYLGAKYFIFHGLNKDFSVSDELYAERFMLLADEAQKYGITVLQENVARCVSGSADFIRRMRSICPDMKFVLDLKQALRAGFSPEEMLISMGDALCHIHMSDSDLKDDCRLFGQGRTDMVSFARLLTKTGFSGAIIEEVYSSAYSNTDELFDSFKVMHNFWKDL